MARSEGTRWTGDEAAQQYAVQVIRELKQSGDFADKNWNMVVTDDSGREVFRIPLVDID